MVKVIKSPYLNTPQLLDVDRSKVRPLVRNLFHVKDRQAPLAGRLKFYPENWEKLTQDVNICCAGFQNSFLPNPISVWFSPISKGEPRGKVINKFRNKGNVEERCNSTGEIRNWGIFEQFVLLNKKDGGHNKSQIFIPYQHFKMEVMHLIKDLLQEHDFLIKINLMDAYFGIPLDKSSRKYIRF